jgi:ribose transport system substrate-binding protein
MKKVSRILTLLFGLVFIGSTLLNADLIGKSRHALAGGVLRDLSSVPSARYELMVVLPDTDDSFYSGLLSGIREAAAPASIAVEVFRYPASAPAEAERYFEIALRAKVDGIVLYTQRNDPIADRLSRAAHEGVILIPVGSDAPPGAPARFIGSGTLLQGFEGGKRICNRLGPRARIGIILPSGGEGDPRSEPIARGLQAAIAVYGGAEIVAVARAEPGQLSGEESATRMLRDYPAINALCCSNAGDTMGVAQVLVDTNKVGKVLLIGADETPEILRYIEKGVVAVSIVRDSRRIGVEAVRAFSELRAGKPDVEAVEVGFTIRGPKGAAP